MNGKARVSKELDEKHRKILEALLKLPENRECADCKSRTPRWASVNLGIFICLQCSGIHRSLGVHISKVRSATLDTWLPEQIASIQTMGNERSNSYWEAELPPNYNRVGIESFIRAKYVEKRWIPRNGQMKSPGKYSQPRPAFHRSELENGSRMLKSDAIAHVSTEKRNHTLPKNTIVAAENHSPEPANVILQVISGQTKPPEQVHKPKPPLSEVESNKQQPNCPQVVPPPKEDYATELFRLLCIDDSKQDGSPKESTPLHLQLAAPQEKQVPGSINSAAPKLSNPSPYPMNQRLTTPSQEKPYLAGAANYSCGAGYYNAQLHTLHGRSTNQAANGIHGHMVNSPQMKIGSVTYSSQSTHFARPGPPIGGSTSMKPGFASSPKPRPSITPTPSGWDYDFSSLTQGLFAKR